jgi:hypothetical protein
MYIYYCVCMFIHKRNCREHVERINWDTTVPPPTPMQTKWRQCSNNLLIVTNLHFWQGGPSVPSSARLRVECSSFENRGVFKDRQIMIFVAWIPVYTYQQKLVVGVTSHQQNYEIFIAVVKWGTTVYWFNHLHMSAPLEFRIIQPCSIFFHSLSVGAVIYIWQEWSPCGKHAFLF